MDSKYLEFKNDCDYIGNRRDGIESLTDDPNSMQQEDILLEFGMYSACDSLISDGGNDMISKDDTVSVDDLNNVSKNDLLFTNTDSYENILLDNDLLNSVSDSVNFYNEPVTLYSNDNSKEHLFDCSSINLPSSNLDLTSNFYQSTDKQNISINATSLENNSVTENLENIVPNLNVCTNSVNSVLNCSNASLESKFSDLPLQPDHMFNTDINVQNSKELDNELSVNKPVKTPVVSFMPDENFNLMEFLNFKGSKVNLNNNDLLNNNNKLTSSNGLIPNGFINVPKENFQAVPLTNAKIISPYMLSLLSNQLNFKIPVKKFKNVNGVARLCVKQSELNELKSKSLKLLKKGYATTVINSNCKSSECIKMSKGLSSDKAIQTCIESSNYNKSEVIKNNSCDVENSYITEKIKKPTLLNNEFIFNFSPSIRKPWGSVTLPEFHRDNDRIHYYTGIPKYSYFMALLNCLNLPNNNVISPFEMLLLTLMKIRLNLDWTDLAYRFDKSVQIVKDAFGITVFILLKCLSRLVHWPMQEYETENFSSRVGMQLYVYGIKLNMNTCSNSETNKRIFICLSTSKHPIHFVSTPVAEHEYNDRPGMLASSGIDDSLIMRDIVIFDEEIDCVSASGDRSVLSVISKTRNSFCNEPYDEYLSSSEKMKDTVSEIKKYKFLYDEITCSWVNETSSDFLLFNDVVKVVCGLVNLCRVLPFCNDAVRNIIAKRKSMEITLT